MKSSRRLLYSSAAASLIFLLASHFVAGDWPVVFKVASVLILATLGLRVDRLLGSALTLGALGDFLLGVQQLGSLDAEKLFLFGLGAFLVGHLVYVAMFAKYRAPNWLTPTLYRMLGIAVILIALGMLLVILRNSLGPLLIPVVAYAVVLAAMAISAMMADPGNPLGALGALFFVASDAMLALSKFRAPFPGHEALIWSTYYLAQLLIYLGVERGYRRLSCPPVNTSSSIEQR